MPDRPLPGWPHYRALEDAMRRALAPHRIDWTRYGRPSEDKTGGSDVNGIDWTTSVHLSGEVWPALKGKRYNMHMRVHIPFSFGPRDADEFFRGVALLKAAADAVTEGGL